MKCASSVDAVITLPLKHTVCDTTDNHGVLSSHFPPFEKTWDWELQEYPEFHP